MGKRYFSPQLFRFLDDLKDNNDRAWFKANQERYEEVVRQPALDFITDIGSELGKISEHFDADARTVGGSLFRIQRDTRFGPDKTPYKLNTGMHFRHERARDAHAPGFYVHLQPRNCFVGVGLWRPETKVAYQIRHHIDAEQQAWRRATTAKKFTERFTLGGESLSRPPKGFAADHRLIEDLKRKDFIAMAPLKHGQVASGAFMETFLDHCRRGSPYMRLLCTAVDVPF